jgi:hypothetical protein
VQHAFLELLHERYLGVAGVGHRGVVCSTRRRRRGRRGGGREGEDGAVVEGAAEARFVRVVVPGLKVLEGDVGDNAVERVEGLFGVWALVVAGVDGVDFGWVWAVVEILGCLGRGDDDVASGLGGYGVVSWAQRGPFRGQI